MFADDVAFMNKHTQIVLLERDGAAVAVAPAYQGRVMTSTVDRQRGKSFGWINRSVIAGGIVAPERRAGTPQAHIHVFGGEDRLWLGPEGGQFALFFKAGSNFDLADWVTPAPIDTEPYQLLEHVADRAIFKHDCELTNYSGTKFSIGIKRTVSLLDRAAVTTLLGEALSEQLRYVAYESDNRITNRGAQAWVPETGLPSIWILGMYNPSPQTTMVIPLRPGPTSELGPLVNDAYFGEVPAEYLAVKDNVLFFKGDGARRGKIGVSPQRSRGVAGSYDAIGNVLTIITYNVQEAPHGYVNSMLEIQREPYRGDAINAYNDGASAPGQPPLGPFYELETSSPAAALAPGETMTHIQRTLHLQGAPAQLDLVARRILGVDCREMATATCC